jgi:hypothetical protein
MSRRGNDESAEPHPQIIERKLQHVQYSHGRWYGQSGDIEREKYLLPIDAVGKQIFSEKNTTDDSKKETDRLDIFHKIFLLARNNELFAAGLDTIKPLRILDLGTGTGIWAIDMSEYVFLDAI